MKATSRTLRRLGRLQDFYEDVEVAAGMALTGSLLTHYTEAGGSGTANVAKVSAEVLLTSEVLRRQSKELQGNESSLIGEDQINRLRAKVSFGVLACGTGVTVLLINPSVEGVGVDILMAGLGAFYANIAVANSGQEDFSVQPITEG